MVSNTVVIITIALALFELESFLKACVTEPAFWLMQFGCTKMQHQKLANWVKGSRILGEHVLHLNKISSAFLIYMYPTKTYTTVYAAFYLLHDSITLYIL